jgi:hypothetical protein
MSEGGEAQNHEAEIEAVARALNEDVPPWTFRQAAEGKPHAEEELARVAIAALDAVRRSPECDGSRECQATTHIEGCFAGPGWREIEARRSPQGEKDERFPVTAEGFAATDDRTGPAGEQSPGWPQGEDHEAADEAVELIAQGLWNRYRQTVPGKGQGMEPPWGDTESGQTMRFYEHARSLVRHLFRCPSPEREPTRLGTVCEQCERRTMEPVYTEDGDAFCGGCAVQLAMSPERDTEKLRAKLESIIDHDPPVWVTQMVHDALKFLAPSPERDTEKLAVALYRQDAAVLANQVEKLVEALREIARDGWTIPPGSTASHWARERAREALAEFSDASKEER